MHDASKTRGFPAFPAHHTGGVSAVLGLKLAPMGAGRPSMSLLVTTTKFVDGGADPRDKPRAGHAAWVNLSALWYHCEDRGRSMAGRSDPGRVGARTVPPRFARGPRNDRKHGPHASLTLSPGTLSTRTLSTGTQD